MVIKIVEIVQFCIKISQKFWSAFFVVKIKKLSFFIDINMKF